MMLDRPSFGAKAFVNGVDSFINSRRFDLAAEAQKRKLPAIYTDVEYVLARRTDVVEGYYGAAKYVDKILHRESCGIADRGRNAVHAQRSPLRARKARPDVATRRYSPSE
jgi:hypothetical protein